MNMTVMKAGGFGFKSPENWAESVFKLSYPGFKVNKLSTPKGLFS
jgi:hypothetical protein